MSMFTLGTAERFYMYLLTFVGVPYRWGGGNMLQGYDCSGAVMEWLDYLDCAPPEDMSAQGIYNHFKAKAGSKSETGIGSLVFYGKSETQITHVAMMIDKFRIIHFGGGDKTTLDVDTARMQGAYGKISRMFYRKDVVEVLRPYLPWR